MVDKSKDDDKPSALDKQIQAADPHNKDILKVKDIPFSPERAPQGSPPEAKYRDVERDDGGQYSGSIKLIYTLGINPHQGDKPINREMVEAIAHDVASALRDRLHTVSGIASVGTAEIEIDDSDAGSEGRAAPTEVRDRGLERLIGGADQKGRYATGTKTANIKGETKHEREAREEEEEKEEKRRKKAEDKDR